MSRCWNCSRDYPGGAARGNYCSAACCDEHHAKRLAAARQALLDDDAIRELIDEFVDAENQACATIAERGADVAERIRARRKVKAVPADGGGG